VSGFHIEELTIPATLDVSPAARDFEQTVEARNAAEAESFGATGMDFTAAELLPGWQESAHEERRLLGARVDGRIVARGTYSSPRQGDAASTAVLSVQVHPAFTGRGIGRALADTLEEAARAGGKQKVHVYASTRAADGPRLDAPTGFGSLPADGREVRFLLARGYALEQIHRASRLALPADPDLLAAKRRHAEERSAEYRVHQWEGRAPAALVEDLAVLATRMSTDAPSAGLEQEEDVWTAERWLDHEEKQAQSPRHALYAAVEHIPSGRLAGYTELSVPPDPARGIEQRDTIVLREHRGHRLGMLLKIANIQQVQERHPGQSAIITFNAEENRHMLDVNEAVGFVPFAYEGAWLKRP
jgi:GNAT superfamily N-acetyltransferase